MSTQTNITNFHALDLLAKLNVNRVILARELSLKEIEEIKNRTKLEIETFIHGAMCVSYSGRCLLSEYMSARNANRGDCTQSCRWNYYLVETTRKDELFPVVEDKDKTTILSSKDLCTLPILNKLLNIKIDSFKIEGRMKSLYYVANTARVYRHAIDKILKGQKIDTSFLLEELDSVSHRPYFTGFYEPQKSSINYNNEYVRKYKFIGYLKRKVKNNLYELMLKDKLEIQDDIEIIFPDMVNIAIRKFKLYDKNFKSVDRGIINNEFYIEIDENTAEWGILRKLINQ